MIQEDLEQVFSTQPAPNPCLELKKHSVKILK